ncbi:hypothetical protein NQ314_018940 [Rhamnusium bicolor]|uniref:Uncharacterized protein n=1 Tax=Rhamnusium bicolor TaxID=1586634 RepID=A0AAV8WQD1_9CUCU|nr:hypothetical protein NQ314_018940 [Rhamnusium bicolor]
MTMGSYEREQKRLQQMLEEVMSDGESQEIAYDDHSDPDQSDEDQLDYVEEKLDNSESEHDISDHEQEEESYSNRLSFFGKDKVTRWRKFASQPITVKTRQKNIVKRFPGSTQATRNLSGPLEIWQHFFNDEIIDIIVACTNEYIEFVANNFARKKRCNSN